MNRFYRLFWKIIAKVYYKYKFNSFGIQSTIYSPMEIVNSQSITIGDNVNIFDRAWIVASNSVKSLTIENGTVIGHYAHIIANYSVIIQKKVLIADKVFLTDCTHSYYDPIVPIVDQPICKLQSVIIGEGSWIGENVCILGVSIGKHCVIGANSVVTSDVPDFSVVAGNPAKIIKRYNKSTGTWISV